MSKASFNFKLQGFTPANRDARIRLVHQVTGKVTKRRPFLDGSLTVRGLDPGDYEVEVLHPNLLQPVLKKRYKLFPHPLPTVVRIPVPEVLFQDQPIRDVPDKDLSPVQQAAAAVTEELAPIGSKGPGEAIRSADWNKLVGAVSDLAGAVLQLTSLVAPLGHDHPEIAERIDDVQDNLRRFSESFGRSLLELRREIETEDLRQTAEEVLDAGGASDDQRGRVRRRITELEKAVQINPSIFTRKLATTGNVLGTLVQDLAQGAGTEGDTFLDNPSVRKLSTMATSYAAAGTQIKVENELLTYSRTASAAGGLKFAGVLRKGRR